MLACRTTCDKKAPAWPTVSVVPGYRTAFLSCPAYETAKSMVDFWLRTAVSISLPSRLRNVKWDELHSTECDILFFEGSTRYNFAYMLNLCSFALLASVGCYKQTTWWKSSSALCCDMYTCCYKVNVCRELFSWTPSRVDVEWFRTAKSHENKLQEKGFRFPAAILSVLSGSFEGVEVLLRI